MADVFTRKQRSRVMAAVKSVDTTPERQVRAILRRLGHRFRLHSASLPGKPDIALRHQRKAIFIHGCFWHQHPCCEAAERPASNRPYWTAKLDRNVARDKRNLRALRRMRWKALVVWECQLRRPAAVEARIRAFLKR